MDDDPIQYETLVERFAEGLLSSLRGHGVGFDFLETWVPDEDPVKGILNMAESADAAGIAAIAVAVRPDTLPAARHDELRGRLADLGTARIVPVGEGFVVRVEGLGADAALDGAAPALRRGLARRLAEIAWEGELDDAEGLPRLDAVDPPVAIAVRIDPTDDHRVREARHRGAADPAARAVLDELCETIRGLPVESAIGHGLGLTLARLLDPDLPRPVEGVLLPANAGPAFQPASRLMRALRHAHTTQIGPLQRYETFEPPPSDAWRSLDDDERLSRAGAGVAAFLAGEGREASGVQLIRIDDDLKGHPIRLIVGLDIDLPAAEKPAFTRRLEKSLKERVETTLQVYIDPLKDQNQLRRL